MTACVASTIRRGPPTPSLPSSASRSASAAPVFAAVAVESSPSTGAATAAGGARHDRGGDVAAILDAIEAEARSLPWPGRAGATDLAVLLAHVVIAVRAR